MQLDALVVGQALLAAVVLAVLVAAQVLSAVAVLAALVAAQVLPAVAVSVGLVAARALPAVVVSAVLVVQAASVDSSPVAPDFQVEWAVSREDLAASMFLVSWGDSPAGRVLFLHSEDDLVELDLELDSVYPPLVALLVVVGPVESPEDLQHCMAGDQLLGGYQAWADGKQAADSASCLHILVARSTRWDADGTKRLVADRASPILPSIRGCSTRAVRPNSIPIRPNPKAGCW